MSRLIRLIRRLDRAIIRAYEFAANVHYFWRELNLPLRVAIRLARDTL